MAPVAMTFFLLNIGPALLAAGLCGQAERAIRLANWRAGRFAALRDAFTINSIEVRRL